MIDNYLPNEFFRFKIVTEIIHSYSPKNISIVGSYGDPNKVPNAESDFDIIYAFETEDIYTLNYKINRDIKKVEKLIILELGVHFQFGFLCSLYFKDDPMRWIDIGIMDKHFALNYLVNFPKHDVYGSLITSKIKEIPKNHLSNLGRKIIKYLNNNQELQAQIAAHRYLNWLNVDNKANRIRFNKSDLEFEQIFSNKIKLDKNELLEYVLRVIAKKDPELFEKIK